MITDIFVFRQDNPTSLAGSLQPDHIFSSLMKQVVMNLDYRTCLAQHCGDLESPERAI